MDSSKKIIALTLISALAICGKVHSTENPPTEPTSTAISKELAEENLLIKGEAAYLRACNVCHDRKANHAGARGAPRLGDVTAWEGRRKVAASELARRVLNPAQGKAKMPVGNLNEEEIQAAIVFMQKRAAPLY